VSRTVVDQPNKAKRLLLAGVVLLALAALASSRTATANTPAVPTPASTTGSWEALFQGFGGVSDVGLYLGPGGLLAAKPPGPISPFFP